jgi:hypothetical protein
MIFYPDLLVSPYMGFVMVESGAPSEKNVFSPQNRIGRAGSSTFYEILLQGVEPFDR